MTSILTVTELNHSVRDLLERDVGRIWLRGELSNLSAPASGHLYFSLKDDQSQVRAAFFKGARLAARQSVMIPRNGQLVRVRARVSLFAPRGDYQLIVEHLEDDGAGAAQQAFEALKQRLTAEGLFDLAHKRQLPDPVRGVLVVTSATGAAIQDVLHVLARRAPSLPVYLMPVLVQGDEAPAELVQAFHRIEAWAADGTLTKWGIDVVLVVRGGGSAEDLQAFNQEAVVRAVASCVLPVVSGVGHEVDVTLCDFAADQRAPTPSAAAELVSPDAEAQRALLQLMQRRLRAAMTRQQHQWQERVRQWQARLRVPERLLEERRQGVDELTARGQRALQRHLARMQAQKDQLQQRLAQQNPATRLAEHHRRLTQLTQRLQQAWQRDLALRHERLGMLAARAQAVSPLAVLGRGYALVQQPDGRLVTRADEVTVGTVVTARLGSGSLQARVEQVTSSPAS